MNKASSSFLIFLFACLITSLPSFAQERRIITERPYQELRVHDRLLLTDLLRLSPGEARDMEIVSLTITAQSRIGQTQLQIMQGGRILMGGLIRPRMTDVTLPFPSRTQIEGLMVSTRGDVYLQSLQAEVVMYRRQPYPQPYPRPYPPRTERIMVREGVNVNKPLDLARLLPYERRLVRSITVEAFTQQYEARLDLASRWGEIIGSVRVTQVPMNPRIQLLRPLPVTDLYFQSMTQLRIRALEIEFQN